jgi:LysR family transcriptional regulator, regulator for genes of the gallate degradation pathway
MLSLRCMDIWQLNLRHLRATATIARLGSVSAAASAIRITQPAITQGVARIEAQLGQPLFDRRPGGMTMTEAARLLVPRIDAAILHIASTRVTMTQLRAIIAVAEAGSYAGAAIATGVAQPSLHRAIADLSVALKRHLVERRGKGIALTDAGRKTARTYRLARAELLSGLAELSALQGTETGVITIGAMPLSRAYLLPAAVSAFHRMHPDVAINIVEGAFHELIEPLRDGAIDLLIGALRDASPGDDVVQRRLFEDRPVIIGRKAHPADTTRLAELAGYPWIVPVAGTPLRAQWERMFADGGLALPRVPIECASVMTIRQILVESDFLTLLSPDQVAVELEAGWLRVIAETPPGQTRTIGVTTRAGWRPTAMQTAFVATLDAHAQTARLRKNL